MTATSAEGLYAGWTIYGHGLHRFLHGALRRESDKGAVWECDHSPRRLPRRPRLRAGA